MSRFGDAFSLLIGHEGGFQAHPNDKGNYAHGKLVGTKYGISARSYPGEDIPNLTLDRAKEIYLRDYWQKIGADSLPAPLALVAFDSAVHHGVSRARGWLTLTLDWRTFLETRLAFIRSIGSADFARGWENRIAKLREQAAAWEAPTGDTVNLINKAAQAALRGELALPKTPGNCLMAVRKVLERAFGWEDMELYTALVTEKVEANKSTSWWAADAEKSIRSRKLQIDATKYGPRPGDLVFNHTSRPYGHVGVIVEHLESVYVLENAQVKRGIDLGGALNLCPLHLWGPITTIGRLPQAEVPAPAERLCIVEGVPDLSDLTGARREFPHVRGVTINAERLPVRVAINLGKEVPATPLK